MYNLIPCVVDKITQMFYPNVRTYGTCVLVWRRNEYNIGLLIDTSSSKFVLVERMTEGFRFRANMTELFNGYIYERKNHIVFEFEYKGTKTDNYIRNKECRFSALKTTILNLQSNNVQAVLTFEEDVNKVYYKYANNTFWNPARKRFFSLNAKYDEHAVSGRYNSINDHGAVFDRGYMNLDY